MIPDHLKLREPNEEQKLAIAHNGGVLLSAGAGSGKTFVLVEHIIYLFEKFAQENKEKTSEDFSQALKLYFSEIVLMTFTKKAAGELSLRLQNRFELARLRAEEGLENLSVEYWEIAEQSLPYIYVGTIHGFCYRLILQGYIPGFTGHEEMIGDVDFKRKIEGLIDLWFEVHFDDIKERELESLVLNKKSLKKSFCEIFSDTDLRVLWANFSPDLDSLDKEEESIKKAFEIFSGYTWDQIRFSLSDIEADSKKVPKWYEFLQAYSEVVRDADDLFAFFEKSKAVFDSLARFPSPPKKAGQEEAQRAIMVAKQLREFLSKYYKDFSALRENFDKYLDWSQVIHNIYQFVEENYLGDKGLTFTDLEFYCWKSMKDIEVAKKINETYRYFIVDEFQDTSKVQFDIVTKILNGDMKKVFTVGDVKQAIYGFRGGELGVFKQAEKDTYQNLSLKNNYRSEGQIISFNNSLFTHLLPLGKEYKGEDSFSVPMVEQTIPSGKESGGELVKLNINVSTNDEKKKSLLATEQNYLEAKVLFDQVINYEDEVCFLYRKLNPSKYLVERLINANIGFTCQVKIDLKEDPLICLFVEFARICTFEKNKEIQNKTLFVVNSILSLLKIEKEVDIKQCNDFISTYKSFGLMGSFRRFLWELGISTGNTEANWPVIEALSKASEDKASLVFENASGFVSGNYSLDFQYGENPQKIKIMTTHASKGLEFSTVVLAGIHTNGSSKSGGGFFGKLPYSYKWLAGFSKSDTFNSPTLIYENELSKVKDFSEFKRLFYVATTRAVNRILWADISLEDKPMSYSKSSWVEGIRCWMSEYGEGTENLSLSQVELDMQLEEVLDDEKRLDLDRPIFHRDDLGMKGCDYEVSPLGIGSELSVTRFAILAQCPRKFFLKNVLKISDHEMELTHESDKTDYDENFEEIKANEVIEEEAPPFEALVKSSSAERGTEVHRLLEHALKRNFILPNDHNLDEKTVEGITWVLEHLAPLRENSNLISEQPIKFSLFGQMISGTPDLIVDNNDQLEVWDFKTGRSAGKDLSSYWLQLNSYAQALLQGRSESFKVRLVLAFIDEKKIIEEKVSIGEVKAKTYSYWKLLSCPDEINTKHCKQCEFDKICQNNI